MKISISVMNNIIFFPSFSLEGNGLTVPVGCSYQGKRKQFVEVT